MTTDDQLNATFSALAHPARRAILAQLARGDATVNELAAPFEMSLPAVSRHIKVLEQAGLIRQGHTAQFRPCTLALEPIEAIASWAEEQRRIWNARFDQMDACLKTITDGHPDD